MITTKITVEPHLAQYCYAKYSSPRPFLYLNRSAESRARPVLPRFRFDRPAALLQGTAPAVLELGNKALLVPRWSPALLRSRQALCGPAKEPFALFCSFPVSYTHLESFRFPRQGTGAM